jgi:hypothetical protein
LIVLGNSEKSGFGSLIFHLPLYYLRLL